MFGSWGRRELTPRSDDDWAILALGPERGSPLPSPDQVEEAIGREGHEPGTQGICVKRKGRSGRCETSTPWYASTASSRPALSHMVPA